MDRMVVGEIVDFVVQVKHAMLQDNVNVRIYHVTAPRDLFRMSAVQIVYALSILIGIRRKTDVRLIL